MTFAIVPMSRLSHAKSRLTGVLEEIPRRRLVQVMFEEVLATLAACPAVESILVVTPDERIAAHARANGAAVLHEAGQCGLNAAVTAGIRCARARGAERLLVVPGDIPLATPDEIATVLGLLTAGADVALAPAHDDGGTNALAFAAASQIAPSFGLESSARHLQQAREHGFLARTVSLPGIARDIDTPADLAALTEGARAARFAFVREVCGKTNALTAATRQAPAAGCPSVHPPHVSSSFHAVSEETP